MTRRAALTVVALVAAALVGVALLSIPGSPFHQSPTLGLDLQGGLEVTLQAVPPRDRELHEGRPRPLRDDHARPRRPARRLRARDPHAGRRSDRDPASRRRKIPRLQRGSSARPPSSSSSTSRRTCGAVDQSPDPPADRNRRSSTTCSRVSRRSPPRGSPRRSISSEEGKEAGRRAGQARARRCSASSAAWSPRATSSSRCRRDTVVVSCAPDALVCPGIGGSPGVRVWYLLTLRPAQRSRR